MIGQMAGLIVRFNQVNEAGPPSAQTLNLAGKPAIETV